MQVDVERQPGSRITLTITVEPEKVKERTEQLFQKYARRVSVPGFRPGKAPRALVESRIDRSALLHDAIDDIIEITYKEALQEENLQPLEQGKVKDINVGEDMSLTYQVELSVFPEVKLPDLAELVVRHVATEVTDELVESQLQRLRESGVDYVEMSETGIENGDFVTIDYTMQVDGEPYPEGDMTGYPLEVGSDTFFPELNEALLNLKTGDTTTITTTYAEDYSNPELAGKTAAFEVAVRSVRRQVLPELDDAWAGLVSNGAILTVDELREQMQKRLEQDAERMDRDHVRSVLLNQLVEKTELEVPATLVEEEYEHLMEELEHRLAHQRISMEEYARNMGQTVADLENEQQLMARDVVRRSMILQEIARRENIHVTEEELNTMVMVNSFSQGGQSVEKIERDLPKLRKEMEKSGQLDRLTNHIFREKILSFLQEHADVEVEGWPKETEEIAEEVETAEAEGAEQVAEESSATAESVGVDAVEDQQPSGEKTPESPELSDGEPEENEPPV
jgi:trigger factor